MTPHTHTPQALSSLAPAGAPQAGRSSSFPVPPAIPFPELPPEPVPPVPFPDPRNHFEEIANAIAEAKLEAI